MTSFLLCSDWEVRAYLDGRKTEFRRPIKPPRACHDLAHYCYPAGRWWVGPHPSGVGWWAVDNPGGPPDYMVESVLRDAKHREGFPSPYAPGSRLCVKETWDFRSWGPPGDQVMIAYAADGEQAERQAPVEWNPTIYNYDRWRSPAVMPTWASRITLLVTACRAERLQEITSEGCIAEGLVLAGRIDGFLAKYESSGEFRQVMLDEFLVRWDSRYGKRPGLAWADNPWVWVVAAEEVPHG